MNRKPTEEELRDMRDEGMSLYQISRIYNTTIEDIFLLENKHGMIPKTSSALVEYYNISKEDLRSMYIDEHMEEWQIAEELGIRDIDVHIMMDNYHISPRPGGVFKANTSIADIFHLDEPADSPLANKPAPDEFYRDSKGKLRIRMKGSKVGGDLNG